MAARAGILIGVRVIGHNNDTFEEISCNSSPAVLRFLTGKTNKRPTKKNSALIYNWKCWLTFLNRSCTILCSLFDNFIMQFLCCLFLHYIYNKCMWLGEKRNIRKLKMDKGERKKEGRNRGDSRKTKEEHVLCMQLKSHKYNLQNSYEHNL